MMGFAFNKGVAAMRREAARMRRPPARLCGARDGHLALIDLDAEVPALLQPVHQTGGRSPRY
jgi:hypothetical protein